MSAPDAVSPATTSRLSRRRVVAGTAWAVPAVTIALAAPAMAASACPTGWAINPQPGTPTDGVVTFLVLGSSSGDILPQGTTITVSLYHLTPVTPVRLTTTGTATVDAGTSPYKPANQDVTDPATWLLALGHDVAPGAAETAFIVNTGSTTKSWRISVAVEIPGCPAVQQCWSYAPGDAGYGNECTFPS